MKLLIKALKHKSIRGVLVVVFLFSCFPVFLSNPVSAFTLRPGIFDISVQPGETHTGTIFVVNDENAEQTYYITTQKFFAKGESGQQEFLPLSDTKGLPSWIYFFEPFFILKPGEAREIPFRVRVPLDAAAGGYYAAIFFSTQPPLQKPQGKIVAGARTGSLVLLTVPGALVQKIALNQFTLDDASVSHLPVAFQTTMENQGNVHVKPQGTITIKNYFGSKVARLPLNPNESHVLPESRRQFMVIWQPQPTRPGSGFWHEAREEWRNFALGRYQATLEVPGGSQQPMQTASLTFFVWPWHLLICIVGFLILLVILARLYRKWILYRATAKS